MPGQNNGRAFDLRMKGISEAVFYLQWKQPAVVNEGALSATLKAEWWQELRGVGGYQSPHQLEGQRPHSTRGALLSVALLQS